MVGGTGKLPLACREYPKMAPTQGHIVLIIQFAQNPRASVRRVSADARLCRPMDAPAM